ITRTFEGCGSIASGPGEHIGARGSAGDGGASERGATGDHALRPDCPKRITGGGRGDDGVPLCGLEGESGVERQPVSILPSAGGGDGGRRVGTVVRRFSLYVYGWRGLLAYHKNGQVAVTALGTEC